MSYYNSEISTKQPQLIEYFKNGIYNSDKNISHCLLFWGPDITSQCELALEIARLLNCKEGGHVDCNCKNCDWVRKQTHPAVKIYTRLDFKEAEVISNAEEGIPSAKGKKNITIEQAKAIISELAISSYYHRVYIFCDRDEKNNLLPLNQINFPVATSNALLKTFEEAPQNTTFIFLTHDKNDVISTVVSRAQSFFVPALINNDESYDLVLDTIREYWTIERNDVLDFENKLLNIINSNDTDAQTIFTQIQNYMVSVLKSNIDNKHLFYKLMQDIKYVEEAKQQMALKPPMLLQHVVENLSFNLIL